MVRRAIYAYQVFNRLRRGACRAAQLSAGTLGVGLGEAAGVERNTCAETKNRPIAGGLTSLGEMRNPL